MRIPGIPGASEPSFRTRGQIWVALDDLVYETCTHLDTFGVIVSPYVCKGTIQVSRQLMLVGTTSAGEGLAEEVAMRLRQRGCWSSQAWWVKSYRPTAIIMGMDIAEVLETGS